jgi:hypothetical protein
MRSWLLPAVVAAVLGAAAQPALAGVTDSTNWAGYAVHDAGVAFRRVHGTWREPRIKCQRGGPTFSSYWVGIGGYSLNSHALEQVGTEVDCTTSGQARAFAWYELIPAPSVPVKLKVPPGDLIKGTVTVRGKKVRVTLADLTDHQSFSKLLHANPVDVSSAEWIVEAPSDCASTNTCVTLPLGDFGSTTFTNAAAESTAGHTGPISDPLWRVNAIDLVPQGRTYVVNHQHLGAGGEATTSSLQPGGSAFMVSYRPLSSGVSAKAAIRLEAVRLEHLGR